MKKVNSAAILFISTVLMLYTSSLAQNIVNIGIGPTWPKDLRDSEKKTAWTATVEYGKIFDNILGFGAEVDFSWNVYYKDSTAIIDSVPVNVRLDENTILMFPVSAFVLLDPIPQFKLHPVVKGQVGFNMMVRSYKELDSTGNPIESPKNGFYIGVIGKISTDAVYDLGQHASVFAGFEYQWGKLRHKRENTSNQYDYFKFYGPGIRMGFSFLF